jgi:diacylglycerol kinase (ATP)
VTAGAELVIAVGGDGTLNEVVNGITGEDGRPLAAAGALLTGRGRDAARTLGLPRDPQRAAERLVQGSETRRDLGLVRGGRGRRYFVTVAGAGFDAVVAARAATLPGRGTVPYLRAVAATLRAHRPWVVSLAVDGAPARSLSVTGVVIANGPCFGGGMRVAPGADASDGRLDVVVLGTLSRAALLRWLPTLYWGGHLRHPRVTRELARAVAVTSALPVPLQLDGEPWGASPFEVTVCPGALRLRG